MDENNNTNNGNNTNSGVNTILIVLVLLIVVGAVVWLFAGGQTAAPATEQNTNGAAIEVTVPEMGNGGEETEE